MCGIAGWFSKETPHPNDIDKLKRMIGAIKHRGPDGDGTKILPHASLGHVRLSIIDVANGHQPMTSHDGQYSIIFNGEIYNYKALRASLINSGHQFLTDSDTEVILEIYRKYGHGGFTKLRGMYAFALWDNINNLGLLVRDPLGIKPLFIQLLRNSTLVFASEAKAIIAKEGDSPEMDLPQLHYLVNFRYIAGNNTLFKGIEQLAPGTILQWTPDGRKTQYSIGIPDTETRSTLDQLRDSISNHLTSDVEIGCYLSGGIDSATIAALSKEVAPNIFRTFTMDAGDNPNEACYAAETANYLGLNNLQSKIPTDIENELSQLVWHLETPKINAMQNWQLAKFTSQHVKVALSGLGGDELFIGYNIHKIMLWAHSLSKFSPPPVSHLLGKILKKTINSMNKLQWSESERSAIILQELGNWPTVYALIRNVWDNPSMRKRIYGERMLAAELPNAINYVSNNWPSDSDPVTSTAKYEWRHKLVNDLLWQEDRVSMAHGLEVRTPLVDVVLHSHMQHFNRHQLMRHGKLKAYMKDTIRPIIPNHILNRPKSGFQVSSPEFFHKHLKQLADDQLNQQKMNEVGLFNYRFVEHILRFPPSNRLRWHYFMIYFMLLTHLWIDIFENNSWQKPR